MTKIFIKIIPALIFWGIFAGVVLTIPYPESFTQAKLDQMTLFFVSIFLALIFTFNILLNNIFLAASVSLGLIFLLVLQALDSLNFVTGILTVISTGLLFSYFKKSKKPGPSRNSGLHNLTKQSKIPKLTRLPRRTK